VRLKSATAVKARVADLVKMHPDGGAFLFGMKCNNDGADEYYQEGQKEDNCFAIFCFPVLL
jgi:hypothetical protein